MCVSTLGSSCKEVISAHGCLLTKTMPICKRYCHPVALFAQYPFHTDTFTYYLSIVNCFRLVTVIRMCMKYHICTINSLELSLFSISPLPFYFLLSFHTSCICSCILHIKTRMQFVVFAESWMCSGSGQMVPCVRVCGPMSDAPGPANENVNECL